MSNAPSVTVVVPTRNERGNVASLYSQLCESMGAREWELVFVDDSDDDTAAVIRGIAADDDRVRLIHRDCGSRDGGLGGAVSVGFAAAQGDAVVVMDADLQHPPPVVPRLADELHRTGADLAVASRYCEGGSAGGLDGWFRRFASLACRRLAYAAFPRTRGITDPLGGFFAVRTSVLQDVKLRPDGYKILLEVLVRTPWRAVCEVPFVFAPRHAGASKSGVTEGRRYLRHLRSLRRAAVAPDVLSSDATAAVGGAGHPMRVLVLTSEVLPIVSGISTSVAVLRDGLMQRGHSVDVVSRADFPKFIRQEIRLSAFALFWPRFRKALHRYDVVNVHGPVPTVSEAFLLLSRTLHRARRPGIVYTHHSDLAIPRLERWCKMYNHFTGRLAHTADVVVVSSEAYRDKMRREQGSPVQVVPWGVASRGKVVERPACDPGVLRVLFVGQLRPYKGVPILIDAVAGQPAMQLTIVGDGTLRSDLSADVARRGLRNVTFRGRVSDDELWKAYSENDVIALPSTTTAEAYGLVLAEGMAAGCIPVASDLPGVREVARRTGLLTKPGSVEDLRATLQLLLHDPELVRQLSAESTVHARDLSVEATAVRYENAFEHAVRTATGRQAALALPGASLEPQAFVAEIAARLGVRRVSLSLLTGGRGFMPLRVWRNGHVSTKLAAAPIAKYVAQQNRPVLIAPDSDIDAELAALLRRPELSSAILLPVHRTRGTVSIVGLSTRVEDEVWLGPEHLNLTIKLLDELHATPTG